MNIKIFSLLCLTFFPAYSMLIVTNSDPSSEQFTLRINSKTAPADILEIFGKMLAKNQSNILANSALDRAASFGSLEEKEERVNSIRVWLRELGHDDSAINNDTALETYDTQLTLIMLDAIKACRPDTYPYIIGYLHAKNMQRERKLLDDQNREVASCKR